VLFIPDTQFMVMNNGYSGAWLDQWIAQADWVVDKQHELNIAAVVHVGDVVEEAHRSWEWDNFFQGWDKIEATGIPWSIVPGNHDLTSMAQPFASNRWDDYNKFIAPAFQRNLHLQSSFPQGKYENSVVFFEAAGLEFMVVGIELGPTQQSLDWASEQLHRHPGRRAIVNNHFVVWGAERGIDVVGWAKGHRNIFMIQQGHDCAREWNRVIYNDWGEPIQEILTDYQCSGDAFLRYYTFRVSEGRVDAFTFSPSQNRFETDFNSQWHFDFNFGDLPAMTEPAARNRYRRAAGVGGWGGWCTCPNGQKYNVGDKDDACAEGPLSLACEGGVPGECVKVVDPAREGMKVTCAASSTPAPVVEQPTKPSDTQPTDQTTERPAAQPAEQPTERPSVHPTERPAGPLTERPSAAPTGQPAALAPTSVPPSPNVYRKVSGVGAWGGWCTCPDGQRYNVGDKNDACAAGPASLACEGGEPGDCVQAEDYARKGMQVTCAGASSSAPLVPASPTPSPPPAAIAGTPPAENHYAKVIGVGSWGGWCTCPDGRRYNVGDKDDACANGPSSLACVGGKPGACAKVASNDRDGMQVTCAAGAEVPASIAGAGATPSAGPACAPSRSWPAVDGGVTCGECKALVLTAPHNTCDAYCQSFGHICVESAEEVAENCEEMYYVPCDEPILGTSDMLCTCQLPTPGGGASAA